MSAHRDSVAPVGGPIVTPTFKALAALVGLSGVLILWRFAVGLGPATAMNDGYAWGTWKIFNVIVLTALGSGGYALAFVVYVLNRGRYHPLVRTAIVTSALGYTTGVVALGVDIGRPWNFWRVIEVWNWNLHSVLLEIAVCISIYLIFLWIEMAVPMMEQWSQEPRGRLTTWSRKALPIVERFFPFILGMALILPTMHQSSLGSLFLLSGPRVHALWQTPLLPLLFLVSCYMLGFAAVIMVSMLASLVYSRPLETAMLGRIARIMAWVAAVFLVIRWADVAYRGHIGAAFAFDLYSVTFLVETALLTFAAFGLLLPGGLRSPRAVFLWSMLVAGGGMLYRLGASLIGFMPGSHWTYFPSVLEIIVTLGFIAIAVMGFQVFVKLFPILTVRPDTVPATRSR